MSFAKFVMQDRKANWHNATKGKYVVVLFRIAQYINNSKLLSIILFWYQPLYRLFVHWILCVELYPASQIGEGLVLWHVHSLVVHPATKIGKGCSLRQTTTIGTKKDKDGSINQNAPIIGDNVDIGANSIIIGPVVIGDNVIIGAGSVVVKDIPSHAIVAGNPARIIGTNTYNIHV
ncbi:serine acetyltransferase [Hymenobacter sp. BT507]|uniref:Serine acetyltransferase n=1 Tax=Hymenobacter citatus TaxID=2763506 RepID=A0ABR7MKP6_9BACT|nr:DapH/DapD/GlmU-related protein [Hymenobacter citatus]MBC6611657.1 serine acetyltransferase [Hymenobacter citatus]